MADEVTDPTPDPPNPITDPEGWVAYRNGMLAPVVMSLRDVLNQVVDALQASGTEHPYQEYQVAAHLSLVVQKLRQLHKVFHDEAARMDQGNALREDAARGTEALQSLRGLLDTEADSIGTEAEKWLRENGGS